MNELTLLIRVGSLIPWLLVLWAFRKVQPPPSRAGRYTGPVAMCIVLGVLVLGSANPVLHVLPSESLSTIYTLADAVSGLLGVAWLMLTNPRK